MENWIMTLTPSDIKCLIGLAWSATIVLAFCHGVSRGKKDLREYFDLKDCEDSKAEWITLPVRLRGVKIDDDTSEADPVTLVLVNVRTKKVRHPPEELRGITSGDMSCGGVYPNNIVLGAPVYVPVAKKPGSILMLGAEYRHHSINRDD